MRGELPIGVSYHKASGKYRAYILKQGRQKHLGLFENPNQAHKSWQLAKAEYMRSMIKIYENELEIDVINSLLDRVSQLEYDVSKSRITEKL
jgi:hypothetical protein